MFQWSKTNRLRRDGFTKLALLRSSDKVSSWRAWADLISDLIFVSRWWMCLSGTQTGMSQTWYAFFGRAQSHFRLWPFGRPSRVVVWQQRGRLLEKVLKRLPVGCVRSLCTLGAAECEAAVKTWTGLSSHPPVPINRMNTPQNPLKYYSCIEND